jgi:hypothetical protein
MLIATIEARGLRNGIASFDTRALRSAIDFTKKIRKYRLMENYFPN